MNPIGFDPHFWLNFSDEEQPQNNYSYHQQPDDFYSFENETSLPQADSRLLADDDDLIFTYQTTQINPHPFLFSSSSGSAPYVTDTIGKFQRSVFTKIIHHQHDSSQTHDHKVLGKTIINARIKLLKKLKLGAMDLKIELNRLKLIAALFMDSSDEFKELLRQFSNEGNTNYLDDFPILGSLPYCWQHEDPLTILADHYYHLDDSHYFEPAWSYYLSSQACSAIQTILRKKYSKNPTLFSHKISSLSKTQLIVRKIKSKSSSGDIIYRMPKMLKLFKSSLFPKVTSLPQKSENECCQSILTHYPFIKNVLTANSKYAFHYSNLQRILQNKLENTDKNTIKGDTSLKKIPTNVFSAFSPILSIINEILDRKMTESSEIQKVVKNNSGYTTKGVLTQILHNNPDLQKLKINLQSFIDIVKPSILIQGRSPIHVVFIYELLYFGRHRYDKKKYLHLFHELYNGVCDVLLGPSTDTQIPVLSDVSSDSDEDIELSQLQDDVAIASSSQTIESISGRDKRLFHKIGKSIEKQWLNDQDVRKFFLRSYSSQYPQHCNDLASENLSQELMNKMLDPLKSILNEFKSQSGIESAKKVVKRIIDHFQIYTSDENQFFNTSFYELIPVREVYDSTDEEAFASELLGPTIFRIISEDFKRLINRMIVPTLNPSQIQSKYHPLCVVTDQVATSVRAYTVEFGIDEWMRLRSVNGACTQKAKECFDAIEVTASTPDESGLIEADLTFDQLDKLHQIMINATPHTLYVISLVRDAIRLSHDELEEALPAMDSLFDDEVRESRESKEDDFLMEGKRPRGQWCNRDPQFAKRHRSRTAESYSVQYLNNRELNLELPSAEFDPLTLREFMPLSDQARSSTSRGNIPAAMAPIDSVGKNMDLEDIMNSDNPWLSRSLNAINVLKTNLSRTQMLRQAILGQPLEYPILSHLKQFENATVAFGGKLHPTIKPYQERMVRQWLQMKDFASPIIAAEPGLGKTLIACEVIAHLISEQMSSYRIFFIGPVSTVNQSAKRIRNYLLDLYHLGWKRRNEFYKIGRDSDFIADLKSEFSSVIASKDCKRWLKLLPLLDDYFEELFTTCLKSHRTNVRELIQYSDDKFVKSPTDHAYPTTQKQIKQKIKKLAEQAKTLLPSGNATFSLDKAKLFSSWPIPEVISCPDKRTLQTQLDIQNGLQAVRQKEIIVTGPQAFNEMTVDSLATINIPLVIFDEAQNIHSETTVTHQTFKAKTGGIRERNDQLKIMLLTGTPLENKVSEIWSLLSVANPKGSFLAQTHHSLASLISNIHTRLKDMAFKNFKTSEEFASTTRQLEIDLLKTFSQFYFFNSIARQLVLWLNMESDEVKQDWENALPTKIVKYFQYTLDDQQLKEIENQFRTKVQGNALTQSINITKILLGGIPRTSLKDSGSKAAYDSFTHDIQDEIQYSSAIQRVPLVQPINTDQFIDGIRNKEIMIIAVDYRITAAYVNSFVKSLFEQNQRHDTDNIMIMTGKTTPQGRKLMCRQLKQNQGVLIMTAKAGGVGIDFPFAHKMFDLTFGGWNQGFRTQLWHRIWRVGYPGNRYVFPVKFGIPQEDHFNATRDEKDLLTQFVFLDSSKPMIEHLTMYCRYLKCRVYREHVNNSRSNVNLNIVQNMGKVDEFLRSILDTVTEEGLRDSIHAITPPVEMGSMIPTCSSSSSSY